jgi:alpha-1,2-mannosyltransferase
VSFVHLTSRQWVEAECYPRFTMLRQSLGSLVLGWDALCQLRPDVFVDSMGYAFTLPLFSLLGGCRVACYVHYPTISTDMLQRVQSRSAQFNNDAAISNSRVLSNAKLLYYRLFAYAYSFVGAYSTVNLVNSRWTHSHICALWRHPAITHVLYPPCDTSTLSKISLQQPRQRVIVSLAQFRPEKNYRLQLMALACLFAKKPALSGTVKMAMIGGCRNVEDEARVRMLKDEAV